MYTFIAMLFDKNFQLKILFSELIGSLKNEMYVQHVYFKNVEDFWRIVLKFDFLRKNIFNLLK